MVLQGSTALGDRRQCGRVMRLPARRAVHPAAHPAGRRIVRTRIALGSGTASGDVCPRRAVRLTGQHLDGTGAGAIDGRRREHGSSLDLGEPAGIRGSHAARYGFPTHEAPRPGLVPGRGYRTYAGVGWCMPCHASRTSFSPDVRTGATPPHLRRLHTQPGAESGWVRRARPRARRASRRAAAACGTRPSRPRGRATR